MRTSSGQAGRNAATAILMWASVMPVHPARASMHAEERHALRMVTAASPSPCLAGWKVICSLLRKGMTGFRDSKAAGGAYAHWRANCADDHKKYKRPITSAAVVFVK